MLPSHQNVMSGEIRLNAARAMLLNSSKGSVSSTQASRCLPSPHRTFHWSTRSRWNTPHAGKVYKGFSSRDVAAAQAKLDEQSYMGAYRRRYLYLHRFRPRGAWRLSSSWRGADISNEKENRASDQKAKIEQAEQEDWYSRWEKQKKAQYDEFIKTVEDDPFSALFGRSSRWLGWTDGGEPTATKSTESGFRSGTSNSQPEVQTKKEAPSKESRNEKYTAEPGGVSRVQTRRTTKASEVEDEEYDIDPITLRKVARKPTLSSSTKTPVLESYQKVDVPVKKFEPTREKPTESSSRSKKPNTLNSGDTPASDRATQNRRSWLAQEGFSELRSRDTVDQAESEPPKEKKNESLQGVTAEKMESALDRHLRSKDSKNRPTIKYEPQENKTEDVDLLRASDVRASAGLRGRPAVESAKEKQERQRKLEEQYGARASDLESQLAQEISKKDAKSSAAIVEGKETDETDLLQSKRSEFDHIQSIYNGHLEEVQASDHFQNRKRNWPKAPVDLAVARARRVEKMAKIRAKLVPIKAQLDLLIEEYGTLKRRLLEEKRRREQIEKKSREIFDREVEEQKAAMETMEMYGSQKADLNEGISAMAIPPEAMDSSQKADVSQSTSAMTIPPEEILGEGDIAHNVHEFAGRDRWYKRKAPHANCEMDAKLERLAKEKSFVRELRGIYEEAYGTIDTKHRQPPFSEGSTPAAGERPSTKPSSKPSATKPSITSEPSFGQDKCANAETLALVQKLYDQLQHALNDLKDQRTNPYLSPENEESGVTTIKSLEDVNELLLKSRKLPIPLKAINASPGATAESTTDTSPLPTSSAPATNDPLPDTKDGIEVRPAATTSTNKVPTVYHILAYDYPAQRVTSAKTTSTNPFLGENALTPLEALKALHNPGKFLPHLTSLHNKGYEIVSGATDILVLKKTDPDPDPTLTTDDPLSDLFPRPNPIDGTTAATTPPPPDIAETAASNYASPTGFVNHDPIIPLQEGEEDRRPPPPSSAPKVRREEDVFSGSHRHRWHEREGKGAGKRNKRRARRRRTVRRMLLTGVVTAVCCYAVGVVVEGVHF